MESDSMNQKQMLPSGINKKVNRDDHDATRKTDSNVSIIIIMHRSHLDPLRFPLLWAYFRVSLFTTYWPLFV